MALGINEPTSAQRAAKMDTRHADDGGWSMPSWLGGSSSDTTWWLRSRVQQVNQEAREHCVDVRWLAEQLGDDHLLRSVEALETQLVDQPFRIALVGEIKHGKSTLFNAIAGTVYSPIQASTSATAAILELYWSPDVQLDGQWLTKETAHELLAFAQEAGGENPSLARWAQALDALMKSHWWRPGGPLPTITTLDEIREYLDAAGTFSSGVERVRVGHPAPVLRGGAVLVDTPGLNDHIRPREALALKAALGSDCIAFVFSAEKVGTESERRFLRQLADGGRAVHIIPIVTRADRLESEEHRQRVVQEVSGLVSHAIEGTPIQALDVLLVDAKGALAEAQSLDGKAATTGSDLDRLRASLSASIQDSSREERYVARVEHALEALGAEVAAAGERWGIAHEQRIPAAEVLAEQEELAQGLQNMALAHREHVLRQLDVLQDRLRTEQQSFESHLAALQDSLLRTIRERLLRHAKEGASSKEDWELVQADLLEAVVQPELRRLRSTVRERTNLWKREFHAFEAECSETLESQLAGLQDQVGQLDRPVYRAGTAATLLLNTKHTVDAVSRKVLAFGAGAGGSIASREGIGAVVTIGSALAGAIASAPAALIAVGAIAGLSLAAVALWDKDKAVQMAVDSRVEAAQEHLEAHFTPLAAQHALLLEQLWRSYIAVAEDSAGPYLREALALAERTRVRRQLWERVRNDGRAVAASLQSGTSLRLAPATA